MQVYSKRTIIMAAGWAVLAGAVLEDVGFIINHKMGRCGFGGVDLGGSGVSSQYPDIWWHCCG